MGSHCSTTAQPDARGSVRLVKSSVRNRIAAFFWGSEAGVHSSANRFQAALLKWHSARSSDKHRHKLLTEINEIKRLCCDADAIGSWLPVSVLKSESLAMQPQHTLLGYIHYLNTRIPSSYVLRNMQAAQSQSLPAAVPPSPAQWPNPCWRVRSPAMGSSAPITTPTKWFMHRRVEPSVAAAERSLVESADVHFDDPAFVSKAQHAAPAPTTTKKYRTVNDEWNHRETADLLQDLSAHSTKRFV